MKYFKKLLPLFLFPILCQAQTKDSTEIRMKQLEGAIVFMSDQLNSAHQEFRIGAIITIVGMVGTASGALISNTDAQKIAFIGGGIITALGGIIMIDSHKFIGKAGSVTLTPAGLKYQYDF